MSIVLINAAIDIAIVLLIVLVYWGIKRLLRKKKAARMGTGSQDRRADNREAMPGILGSNATSPVLGPFPAPRVQIRDDSKGDKHSD